MDDDTLLAVLHEAAEAVRRALTVTEDWGLSGGREGQYVSDLAADAAALEVLEPAGLAVLSEESGWRPGRYGSDLVVALDPLDGSTNASHRVPWYATSLAACDSEGPRAAVVVNLVSGTIYEATRGGGARRDGAPLRSSGTTDLGDALVALSGFPPEPLGWRQYRALGAAALDLCAVAEGVLDAYVDCSGDAHGCWDYLGGMLVCSEAGAPVVDAYGRDLLALEHTARRTPVAASTPQLLDQLLEARRSAFDLQS